MDQTRLVQRGTKPESRIDGTVVEPEDAADQSVAAKPPAMLLKLPNELLVEIVELAIRTQKPLALLVWGDEPVATDSELARSLTLVCRRLRSITTPYLYERLRIGFSTTYNYYYDRELMRRRAFHLFRSFEENPPLRNYCRSLDIHLSNAPEFDPYSPVGFDCVIQSVINLASFLDRTKQFRLFRGLGIKDAEDGLWEVVCTAARHMDELEEVALVGCCQVTLSDIRETLGVVPNLKSLFVAHCIVESGPWLSASNPETRFSSLTSLAIYAFPDGPTNLKYFLRGPLKLERFRFHLSHENSEYYDESTDGPWTLPRVFSLLAPHRETLRFIEIGTLYNSEVGLVGSDLARFTSLEELTLPYRNTGGWVGQEEILTAPRLRKFTWDFASNDQQIGPHLEEFSNTETIWVRKFILTATACGSPLKEIHIIFKPDVWSGAPPIWPWDRMDALHDLAQKKGTGISVTYFEPTVARDAFDDEGPTESPHFPPVSPTSSELDADFYEAMN